ncbi:MAG: hypothetical protein M3R36_17090 [Bacteroidota bacterium]|nr:hypothetical protein [Bacteroidota bacterium]
MKNKIIFRSAVSFIAVLAIVLAMALTATESNGSANPVLTLRHITLNTGNAHAEGNGNYYTGTVNAGRTTFVNMPAGTYHIHICGTGSGTSYTYVNNSFYYNGSDQGTTISLGTGYCLFD